MYTFAQKAKATQQNTSSKSMMTSRLHFGQSRVVNSILQLQRTIGNQSLQRLLQSDAEERNAVLNDIASHNAGHSFNFANIPVLALKPISVQPKLTFGQSNEKYEQEPDSKETVRGGGTDKTAIIQPPEPSGPQDIVLNSELPDREQALAVTLNRTIYVSPDASHLPKPEFNRLIAHESVHVDQQNLPGRPGTRSALEHEANNLSSSATAGRPLRPQIPASPRTSLHTGRTIGTGAADQQVWVSRVDTLVRNRFGLTGMRGRMTDIGRVTFQDTAAFAQGFGRQPRDMLTEAFAESWGGIVFRIKDFYNYYTSATFDPSNTLDSAQQFVNTHISSGFLYWNYHALDWTEYGLTGITSPAPFSSLDRVPGNPNMVNASLIKSVTRAQAQAAERRQSGVRYELTDASYGFTWPANPEQTTYVTFHIQVPLSRVTRRVSVGEILAETFGGVTTGSARGSRRIRIQSTPAQLAQPATRGRPAIPAVRARPANVSTLVHEACHFYTHNNFNRFVDSVCSAGTSHRTLSTGGGILHTEADSNPGRRIHRVLHADVDAGAIHRSRSGRNGGVPVAIRGCPSNHQQHEATIGSGVCLFSRPFGRHTQSP